MIGKFLSLLDRKPRNISDKMRARVIISNSFRCRYCGKIYAPLNDTVLEFMRGKLGDIFFGDAHIDHIVPVADGGGIVANLALACRACNLSKGKRRDIHPRELRFYEKVLSLVLFIVLE